MKAVPLEQAKGIRYVERSLMSSQMIIVFDDDTYTVLETEEGRDNIVEATLDPRGFDAGMLTDVRKTPI